MAEYIITGASSEIGLAFLETLNWKSAGNIKVHGQYFSDGSRLKELAERFEKVELRLYQCDLSSPEETECWIAELSRQGMVPTHILHLAAQKLTYMRLKQFDWKKTLDALIVQVNSFAQLCKFFLPIMSKHGFGRVAVMLTDSTFCAPPKYMTDYLIAKHALLGLMKSAACEYAGTGVTVNGLSPGMIETKFLSKIDPRIAEMAAQSNPMKRNVQLEEVVHALRFLLSDNTGYMTGINLNLSGGEKM